MKKIILDSKFSLFQKVTLFVGFIITLYYGGMGSYLWILGQFDDLGNIVFVFPVLLLISIPLFMLLFSKQGIVMVEQKLYYAFFFFKKPFYKKKIALDNITDVSILTFDAKEKFTYVFNTIHDINPKIEFQELYLLNANHTQKTFVISSTKREQIKKAASAISATLNFKIKTYSPPRSKRRRR